MVNEAFIEGEEIDLSGEFSNLITYALDDVKEFAYRNTSKCLEVVLPGSQRNNIVFGGIFDVKNSNFYNPLLPNIKYNFNAAVSARIIIFQDKIQVFKGVIRITEIISLKGNIEYNCSMIGELGGFIFKLAAKKIEELDFSAYNQAYTVANIVNSWDNAGGAGLWYGHIDYGTYSANKHDWQYKTFRPDLYLKEYIEKIIHGAGFTFDFPLLSTPRLQGLVIPHNQQKLTRVSKDMLKFYQTVSVSMSSPSPDVGFSLQITDESNTVEGDFLKDTPWPPNYGYVYNSSVSKTVSVTVSINITSISNVVQLSVFIGSYTGYINISTGVGLYTQTFTGIALTGGVPFTYALIRADKGNQFLTGSITYDSMSYIMESNEIGNISISLGNQIIVNDAIPRNILQIDVIKSIIRLFNLYVYDDKFKDNHLVFKPYIDFYDLDVSNAEDWSNKINREKAIIIKPMSENNSRYYKFSYKEDSDYFNEQYRKRYNESYGSYTYDSQFEFGNDTNEADIIFSGTPIVGYVSEDKVYSTIFKKSGTTEETIDSNIRLLQTKKITGVSSWDMLDGATVLGSYTKYAYTGHLDDPDVPSNDLNFGATKELFFGLATGALNVNQFNVYWSPYMAEITDKNSKLIKAYAFLSELDINNLDFSKFKYIDGSLFRLNKVEDYNSSRRDECKIELLKVINTEY